MKFHDINQNEDAWLELRAGKLTASNMGKVMANYGKAFGEPAKKLAVVVAVEQITGELMSNDSFSNEHMERGHIQEPIARALYEMETFCDVGNGGFFEDGALGCSPDGLVFDSGMIEIKSVVAPTHYATIKRGAVDPAYKWQVYFNLQLTKRDWIDFVSYCADFPEPSRLHIIRVERGDCTEQFKMIDDRVGEFFELVDEIKRTITHKD